jgi:hypothetical protein
MSSSLNPYAKYSFSGSETQVDKREYGNGEFAGSRRPPNNGRRPKCRHADGEDADGYQQAELNSAGLLSLLRHVDRFCQRTNKPVSLPW